MPSSELTHWMAFSLLEPFGGEVDDYRAGIGAAMRVNSHLKEGAEPVSPLALFPWTPLPEDEVPAPEKVSADILRLFDGLPRE